MTIFSSCALIFNKSYDLVRVNSSPNAILINRKDTLVSDSAGNTKLRIPRQAIDVNILVKEKADSFYYTLILKHQLDEIYYFNFFNYGIGYLVDLSTYKKWGYPENVRTYKGKYSKPKFEQVKIQDKPDLPKGQIRVDISFPYFNWFYFDAIKPQHQFGFIGLSYGLDYIYGKNKFLNFKASAVIDNDIPIPLPIDKFNYDTSAFKSVDLRSYSFWLSLMNFHQIGIMSLGYGLSFGHNFSSVNIENNNPLAKVYSNANSDAAYNTFGSQFSVYFSLFKYGQIGLMYRPTFYCPYQMDNFIYEHLISIDFGLKIPNNQKTKKK